MNSSENGSLEGDKLGFDPTQSLLSLRSLVSALSALLTSSQQRLLDVTNINKDNSLIVLQNLMSNIKQLELTFVTATTTVASASDELKFGLELLET